MKHTLIFALLFILTSSLTAQASGLTPSRSTLKEIHEKLGKATGVPGSGMSPGLESLFIVGDGKDNSLYSLILKVPAHTKIEAHSHPDDRVCFVLEGLWYIGYGNKHDEKALKELPVGSQYNEPANANHFASTRDGAAMIECTSVGPTGTTFVK